jgi:hypothetical protein
VNSRKSSRNSIADNLIIGNLNALLQNKQELERKP